MDPSFRLQPPLDINAFSVARRIQLRTHAVRHRKERLLAWAACYRQVRRHAAWHVVLTPEAINEAHTAHVVLDMVGQPIWSN